MRFSATIISALTLAFVASASPLKRDSHSAVATWYAQGGNAGSCGDYNSDGSHVVAIPGWLHQSSNCGKTIQVTHNGKSVNAVIADTCPTCDGYHIDLSKGAFSELASFGEGEIDVEWHML